MSVADVIEVLQVEAALSPHFSSEAAKKCVISFLERAKDAPKGIRLQFNYNENGTLGDEVAHGFDRLNRHLSKSGKYKTLHAQAQGIFWLTAGCSRSTNGWYICLGSHSDPYVHRGKIVEFNEHAMNAVDLRTVLNSGYGRGRAMAAGAPGLGSS